MMERKTVRLLLIPLFYMFPLLLKPGFPKEAAAQPFPSLFSQKGTEEGKSHTQMKKKSKVSFVYFVNGSCMK